MFAPKEVWRRWRIVVPQKVRQYALASSIAATALPALVEARGHVCEKIPELPLVVDNEAESIKKTKDAVALLKKLGAYEDCEKSKASKRIRGNKGKRRDRRFLQKKGPLVIYKNSNGIADAFRNVPGVTTMRASRLNMLKIAPGGHVGRLTIWTQDAFEYLNEHFGDYASGKTKLHLPIMKTSDVRAIIKNVAQRGVVRPPQYTGYKKYQKLNPFKNAAQMAELNPAFSQWRVSLLKKMAEKRAKQALGTAKKPVVQKAKAKAQKKKPAAE
jgi:large subunit ribosomal protein L4e